MPLLGAGAARVTVCSEEAKAIWSQEWTHGAQLLNPLICGNQDRLETPAMGSGRLFHLAEFKKLGGSRAWSEEDLEVEERKTGGLQRQDNGLRWRASVLELCSSVI